MTEPFADQQPMTIALPVADRRTTFAFYAEGLGFRPLGDPGEDGVPEPLQFALNDGARVMFIMAKTGSGCGVTGSRQAAHARARECAPLQGNE
jgi:catechol 2,3-dioxygenase-like lactoylglutathione lyase family enzyme